jgi:hypothetical protein
MSYNNSLIISGKDIVICFASYFSKVYVDNLITPTFTDRFSSTILNNLVDINLNSCTLSITYVLNELDNINNKTNTGPNMISNYFFIE